MVEEQASGDFAYLFVDPDQGDSGIDDASQDVVVPEIGHYEPPPLPWYRTTRARIAMGAIGVAVVGILVSSVLLAFDRSRAPTPLVVPSISVTDTEPATAATTAAPDTQAPESPSPSPPPPAADTASPVITQTQVAPGQTPRQTKEPEIGVTRTPATRSPISVEPSRRARFP